MIRLCRWLKTYIGNVWWGLGNVAWALDVFTNVSLLVGARESISARLGRLRSKHKAADIVCDIIDKIDPSDLDHCEESVKYWNKNNLSRISTLMAKVDEEVFQSKNFFDFSPDLLCIVSEDLCFKAVNPAWERILGYPLSEIVGKPISLFIHPDDAEMTRDEAQNEIHGRDLIRPFINHYRHKDGSYRTISWTASKCIDGYIYGVGREIMGEEDQ